jgi:hypothetical protein
LTGEVLDKFAQLVTTALGLVAALAWNTAIQNLFDKVFGKAALQRGQKRPSGTVRANRGRSR